MFSKASSNLISTALLNFLISNIDFDKIQNFQLLDLLDHDLPEK